MMGTKMKIEKKKKKKKKNKKNKKVKDSVYPKARIPELLPVYSTG